MQSISLEGCEFASNSINTVRIRASFWKSTSLTQIFLMCRKSYYSDIMHNALCGSDVTTFKNQDVTIWSNYTTPCELNLMKNIQLLVSKIWSNFFNWLWGVQNFIKIMWAGAEEGWRGPVSEGVAGWAGQDARVEPQNESDEDLSLIWGRCLSVCLSVLHGIFHHCWIWIEISHGMLWKTN